MSDKEARNTDHDPDSGLDIDAASLVAVLDQPDSTCDDPLATNTGQPPPCTYDCADLQRENEIPKTADGKRHDPQKHHDGPMHRPELVVELRQHDPAGCALVAKPLTDDRDRLERVGQLPPHDHHQSEAEQ